MRQLLFLLCMISFSLHSYEIVINTESGEAFVFDVDPEESFGDLHHRVIALVDDHPQGYWIQAPSQRDLKFKNHHLRNPGGDLGDPRNFNQPPTPEELEDIRFIVTTLANRSMVSLAWVKKKLEEAGNRIDHIHPLRFLETVFIDEELKVGVRNIRGNGVVWKHFIGGLKKCLSTEASHNNITPAQIQHFARSVGIRQGLILQSINERQWDEFIDLLIEHIPRQGDHDRYDCCIQLFPYRH